MAWFAQGGDATMGQFLHRYNAPSGGALWTLALTLICFTLTSETWISWHYHLMELAGSATADALAMVVGYLCQALGMAIAVRIARTWPSRHDELPLACIIAAHFTCAVPAVLGTNLMGTATFGLLMNVLCGVIAARYLVALADCVERDWRGITFGLAYACSTIVTWLLSKVPATLVVGIPSSLCFVALLSVCAALLILHEAAPSKESETEVPHQPEGPDPVAGRPTLTLAALTVLFMSLVKNIGFSFPSSDFASGVNMETSRLCYAVGLVIAGLVNDRQRMHGAYLCVVALVTPFALLAVAHEPIPATMLWAADYLFYGFFSVYRVVLFTDLADRNGAVWLACLGLLFGRVGDAAGTALCQSLTDSTMVLVLLAAVLFGVTIMVAAQLFQRLYMPVPEPAPRARSEAEVFDQFAVNHDLSPREREVLRQVLAERTNAEAAAELFVTESTVKYHVHNVLKKTGCANRIELMALYAQERAL